MGRSLVQMQQRRSVAGTSGEIAQAMMKTVVQARCTGSAHRDQDVCAHGVRVIQRNRAGIRGTARLAKSSKPHGVPPQGCSDVAGLSAPGVAAADGVRNRLHGLP